MKKFSEFHKHKQCYMGVNTVCIRCREKQTRVAWKHKSDKRKIIDRLKSRCAARGLDFNLVEDDLIIPDVCPVFGTPFGSDVDSRLSIDRIDPKKGYIRGNIQIISDKANRIKSNATSEEIRLVYEYTSKGVCEII